MAVVRFWIGREELLRFARRERVLLPIPSALVHRIEFESNDTVILLAPPNDARDEMLPEGAAFRVVYAAVGKLTDLNDPTPVLTTPDGTGVSLARGLGMSVDTFRERWNTAWTNDAYAWDTNPDVIWFLIPERDDKREEQVTFFIPIDTSPPTPQPPNPPPEPRVP
jgi:hypothetical protein